MKLTPKQQKVYDAIIKLGNNPVNDDILEFKPRTLVKVNQLGNKYPPTQTEVAKHLKTTRQNISQQIDALERKGLIERKRYPKVTYKPIHTNPVGLIIKQ